MPSELFSGGKNFFWESLSEASSLSTRLRVSIWHWTSWTLIYMCCSSGIPCYTCEFVRESLRWFEDRDTPGRSFDFKFSFSTARYLFINLPCTGRIGIQYEVRISQGNIHEDGLFKKWKHDKLPMLMLVSGVAVRSPYKRGLSVSTMNLFSQTFNTTFIALLLAKLTVR